MKIKVMEAKQKGGDLIKCKVDQLQTKVGSPMDTVNPNRSALSEVAADSKVAPPASSAIQTGQVVPSAAAGATGGGSTTAASSSYMSGILPALKTCSKVVAESCSGVISKVANSKAAAPPPKATDK